MGVSSKAKSILKIPLHVTGHRNVCDCILNLLRRVSKLNEKKRKLHLTVKFQAIHV